MRLVFLTESQADSLVPKQYNTYFLPITNASPILADLTHILLCRPFEKCQICLMSDVSYVPLEEMLCYLVRRFSTARTLVLSARYLHSAMFTLFNCGRHDDFKTTMTLLIFANFGLSVKFNDECYV